MGEGTGKADSKIREGYEQAKKQRRRQGSNCKTFEGKGRVREEHDYKAREEKGINDKKTPGARKVSFIVRCNR